MMYKAVVLAALLLAVPLERADSRALRTPVDAIQFLERYNDLLNIDDLENQVGDPMESPQPFSSGLKVAEYPKWIDIPSQTDTTWLRLLRGALANGKRALPDRAKRGWNRGCFGLKLDRIGSLSGLGC
ncbi:C-type natriuretic peptide-like isoform X2 [Conger conger]|uniref:C-type natriuretic peptide-like isoform X2 n=1 Tax=Conger conger TaxID=82655 RepID=UPI002A59C19E|nr:C-type natriuretic peptide-like isoform X2 [Conger conger]